LLLSSHCNFQGATDVVEIKERDSELLVVEEGGSVPYSMPKVCVLLYRVKLRFSAGYCATPQSDVHAIQSKGKRREREENDCWAPEVCIPDHLYRIISDQ
jgi:hypothetical protein